MNENLPADERVTPIRVLSSSVQEVQYGVFLRWPKNGTGWIHTEDVQRVLELIPSNRIFCRVGTQGKYNLMRYGDVDLRLKPALWMQVEVDGYLVGDYVEIRSLCGKNDPGIAQIREMRWNDRASRVEYHLLRRNMHLEEKYLAEDIRATDWVPLPELEPELRIPPPSSSEDYRLEG